MSQSKLIDANTSRSSISLRDQIAELRNRVNIVREKSGLIGIGQKRSLRVRNDAINAFLIRRSTDQSIRNLNVIFISWRVFARAGQTRTKSAVFGMIRTLSNSLKRVINGFLRNDAIDKTNYFRLQVFYCWRESRKHQLIMNDRFEIESQRMSVSYKKKQISMFLNIWRRRNLQSQQNLRVLCSVLTRVVMKRMTDCFSTWKFVIKSSQLSSIFQAGLLCDNLLFKKSLRHKIEAFSIISLRNHPVRDFHHVMIVLKYLLRRRLSNVISTLRLKPLQRIGHLTKVKAGILVLRSILRNRVFNKLNVNSCKNAYDLEISSLQEEFTAATVLNNWKLSQKNLKRTNVSIEKLTEKCYLRRYFNVLRLFTIKSSRNKRMVSSGFNLLNNLVKKRTSLLCFRDHKVRLNVTERHSVTIACYQLVSILKRVISLRMQKSFNQLGMNVLIKDNRELARMIRKPLRSIGNQTDTVADELDAYAAIVSKLEESLLQAEVEKEDLRRTLDVTKESVFEIISKSIDISRLSIHSG